MDKVQTQGKSAGALRSQGLCVETDCGDIEVIPYDDGIANGIKIFLGDTLVAMVGCYRKIDDEDEPEARLLVYGLEGPDCDEPQETIILN